jgi:hypothetical protein
VRGNRPWIRSVGKWLTKRKTVSAKTKESARQKLKKLLNDQERLQAESLPPIDETVMVVSQLLDWWHKAIVATRRETNAINLLAMIRETSMPYRCLIDTFDKSAQCRFLVFDTTVIVDCRHTVLSHEDRYRCLPVVVKLTRCLR